MLIRYQSSVKVPAGWRSVTIRANAHKVSPGFAVVDQVVMIDGEPVARSMSRTGANRQSYHGTWWASIEEGKRKRLSACDIIEE